MEFDIKTLNQSQLVDLANQPNCLKLALQELNRRRMAVINRESGNYLNQQGMAKSYESLMAELGHGVRRAH